MFQSQPQVWNCKKEPQMKMELESTEPWILSLMSTPDRNHILYCLNIWPEEVRWAGPQIIPVTLEPQRPEVLQDPRRESKIQQRHRLHCGMFEC